MICQKTKHYLKIEGENVYSVHLKAQEARPGDDSEAHEIGHWDSKLCSVSYEIVTKPYTVVHSTLLLKS